MAKDTLRDRVWDMTLTMTVVQGEAATPDKVADMISPSGENISRKTVADTLLTMSERGWLIRETMPDGHVRYIPNSDGKLSTAKS